MKKELSGAFLSKERFEAALHDLATGQCPATHVRLFHNEPHHTTGLLEALSAGNNQVQHLDIFELDEQLSTPALWSFLTGPASQHITTLSVHHLQTTAAAKALGQALSSMMCNVQELALDSLTDAELAAVLSPIAEVCSSSTAQSLQQQSLQVLRLFKCQLGNAAAAAVAGIVGLRTLHAADSAVHDDQASALLSAGAQGSMCSSLRSLELLVTGAAPSASAAIGRLLADPTCALSHLSIAGSGGVGDAGVASLAHGLAHNSSLQHLDLSACNIGAEGAGALATSVGAHPALEVLLLSNNSIGAQGLLALVRALGSSANTAAGAPPHQGQQQQQQAHSLSKLQRLQLDGNGIKGAELATALQGSSNAAAVAGHVRAPLQWLSLASNFLADTGAELLEAALRSVQGLQHMDLTGNGISAQGAGALVNLLSGHPSLKALLLDGNRLHNDGVQQLLPAVLQHAGLHAFRADGNRLTDPSLKARVAEATMLVSARSAAANSRNSSEGGGSGRLSARSSLETARSFRAPRRIGTRFSPDVYAFSGSLPPSRTSSAQPMDIASPRAGVGSGGGAKHQLDTDDSQHQRHLHAVRFASTQADSHGPFGLRPAYSAEAGMIPSAAAYCDAAGSGHHMQWERSIPMPLSSHCSASVYDGAPPSAVLRSAASCCGPSRAAAAQTCQQSQQSQQHQQRRKFYKPLTAEQQSLFDIF